LRFDDTHAALVEAGRVLVPTTPLDAARSDFALSGAFLPLVHQAARVLARGTAAPALHPGDTWSAPASAEWRIEDEAGRDVPVTVETTGGATRAVSMPLERTGLYRAFAGPDLRASFAVNPDPVEGDLSPMPDASLIAAFPGGRARSGVGDDLAARVRESWRRSRASRSRCCAAAPVRRVSHRPLWGSRARVAKVAGQAPPGP
jgi:hypothetical protein